MSAVELNKNNLQEIIQKTEIVIVDFWAPWCGPCRAFAPIFDKVAAKNPDIVFGKVNTDVETELATAFEIRSIPTLAIFKDKDLIFYQPGSLPEEAFEQLIGKIKDLDMVELRKEAAKEDNEGKE